MAKLPPKQVQCDCGQSYTISQRRLWCKKCMSPVFYDPKDKRRHKMNSYYFWGAVLAAFTFVTYLFMEMIVTPIMNM